MKIERFSFNNVVLRDDGDFLCLTDMWRAAGGDDSKRPAAWLRSAGGAEFREFIEGNLNVGNSHIEIVRAERGGADPATWAHWQLALAYAKYLSPAFHAWCNDVVRKVMQVGAVVSGAHASQQVELLAAVRSLASAVLEQTKDIADLRVELRQLADRGSACVTRAEAQSLAARIVRAGKMEAELEPTKKAASHRLRIRMRVLASAGWSGAGCRYDNLPAHRYAQAERHLSIIERDLFERREGAKSAKQGQLFLLKPEADPARLG